MERSGIRFKNRFAKKVSFMDELCLTEQDFFLIIQNVIVSGGAEVVVGGQVPSLPEGWTARS